MLKIKLTIPGLKNADISSFIDFNNKKLKNYKFIINSDKEEEVDAWFIFEDILKKGEKSFVNPKNIFYLTAEASLPYDYYNKDYFDLFFSQFHKVYSCYPLFGKNVESSIPFLPWMINSNHGTIFEKNERDVNFFRNLTLKKNKNISVICSKQQWQPGHQLRYNFVKKLKEYFGDKLDWYGNGINPINKKWDGIAPYKYHIVLENRADDNFITEKIYDSFLGSAFPIYWGASNLNEYFSSKSFERINILDFLGSVKKIEKIIESDLFENRLKELNIAKELVLNKYNLFSRISAIIESRIFLKDKKENISLRPSSYFLKKSTFISLLTSPKKQINIFSKILRILLNKIIKLTDA
jgi:hypothetical protein